ncbi:MAG: SUMF1/EgtB/PvdO family nonheme iron enzyme [Haliscomenobacter sp.]|nr:SUMF1/EgtB/PvdO family nonheme iron enzyme [Haliscomenobacter sp.]
MAPNFEGAPKDGSAWTTGGDQDMRVVRGGSWSTDDFNCRVSFRVGFFTDIGDSNFGFRLAGY